MDLASGYYKTAITDFKIAKLLYDNQEYPNSIYNLQQSVEKLSKAFGLKNQIIGEKQLERKISHNSKKVFTIQLQKSYKEFGEIAEVEKIFPDIFKYNVDGNELDFIKMNSELRSSIKQTIHLNPEDFHWLTNEDIDGIIQVIKSGQEINVQKDFNFEEFEKKSPVIFNSIINQLEEKTGESLGTLKQVFADQKFTKNLIIKVFSHTMTIQSIYVSLFFFSLITSSHNQTTRYPCTCCGELPVNNYNMDNAIVSRFKDLVAIYEKTIKLYEEVFIKEKARR